MVNNLRTEYIRINSSHPEPGLIEQAASLILQGELVAFPTETVYGLGASAFLPRAVEKIFTAKERPGGNPLLVHVSQREQINALVGEVPKEAVLLMDTFWPGPLSIVLPARPEVPPVVTGGKPNVGLRMPAHSVALALIDAAGPIAAPSANLSSRPSPLTAEHVLADLEGRIAAILDGGPTGLGVESTVVDLCHHPFRLIRMGGVSSNRLEEVLGQPLVVIENENTALPHYQIKSQVALCSNEQDLIDKMDYYRGRRKRVGVVNNSSSGIRTTNDVIQYRLDLSSSNTSLYSLLRQAEEQGVEVLLFAPFTDETDGITAVVIDRIRRAARRIQG